MQIDAALAAKLAAVLKKVAHGKTLAVAAAEAGIGASEVERIVKELDRELWARARTAESPPDPRTRATLPDKPAKKKAGRKPKRRDGLELVAYADGGSRGNPGKAACAAVIMDTGGGELLRRGRLIGRATNNVAEYEGVLLALSLCRDLGANGVTLRLDSELVVRQLEGRYRVKHAALARLHERARELMGTFDSFAVEHVPRKDNELADQIVNATLSGRDVDLG